MSGAGKIPLIFRIIISPVVAGIVVVDKVKKGIKKIKSKLKEGCKK